MQAITTRYCGPTNSRGSRVIAECDAKRRVSEWQSALGSVENHARAARALAAELGWEGQWAGAQPKGNGGWVWVPVDRGADLFTVAA